MAFKNPDRKGRWRRFSLRGLLVAMTMCCAALGVWTVVVAPYRNQWLAMQTVIDANGTYRTEPARDTAWRRWLVSRLLGAERFVDVVEVDLQRARLDDAAAARLAALRRLRALNLDRSAITDDQLAFLRGLRELETLSVRFTAIGDEGVAALTQHPRLRVLQLSGTRVSDSAAPVLQSLPQLAETYLRWTDFSDAGLDGLAEDMPRCRIFRDGADSPQAAKP